MVLAGLVFLCAVTAQGATYFVNDLNPTGDVYTTAIGNDANSGLSNSAPKLTVTNLVATYSLVAGDTVYIDTGLYTNYTAVFSTSGSAGNPFRIIGSTNLSAGGSVFDRKSTSANVLQIAGSFVEVRNLTLRGGQYGVLVSGGMSNLFDSVTSVSNNSHGFYFQNPLSHQALRSVSAFNGGNGIIISGLGPVFWDYGVVWSNASAAFSLAGTLSLSNSVIVGGTAFASVLPILPGSDYNVFWNTILGRYDDLSDAVRRDGLFLRSTFASPEFANPSGLDFRPKSVIGRYDPVGMTWVTDAVHSVLIDFADPSDPYSDEPAPNGGVANAGSFGNHSQASKSRTNAWVYAISFNDGGNLNSSGTLVWGYGAMPATSRVDLSYSPNGGQTWSPVAASVPVTNRLYTWDASTATSSPRVLWRLIWNANTNVWDQNDQPFVVRASNTHQFVYYVNDTSTVNDVYTTAPGAATNTGLSAASPRLTAQSILDSYDLGGGDIVYIDAGLYTNTITAGFRQHGEWGNPVRYIGSTNFLDTILRPGNTTAFTLEAGANHSRLENFFIDKPQYGVGVSSGSNEFHRLTIRGAQTGLRMISGFYQTVSETILYSNVIAVVLPAAVNNVSVERSVIWGIGSTAFTAVNAGQARIRNNILGGGGVIFSGSGLQTNMDYNIFWGAGLGGSIPNLYELQKNQGIALNSTYADPLFVEPTNLNFHLRSVGGRWNVATASLVTDAVHSVGIDFGDPAEAFAAEPAPNGGRVNVGSYGNTPFAGRSRTNAWLLATSLNDGGQLSIGDSVRWTFGNLASGATVRIEYSGDNGASWQMVATNIAASSQSYAWSNTNYPSSYFGRYRVVLESQPSVLSSNLATFTFRNGIFVYYLNDNSLNGDVFTTAVGSDQNTGTTPQSPRADLAKLFDDFDLEPGDVVYVDTGLYRTTQIPQIKAADSGVSTNPVRLIFSPNLSAGGSVLDRINRGTGYYGLHFTDGATDVEVHNVIVTNALAGIRISRSTNIVLRNVRVRGVADVGFSVVDSAGTRIERSVAYRNGDAGLRAENNVSASVVDSVFWRNSGAQIQAQGGVLFVTGTVLVASEPVSLAYRASSLTNIVSDYNAIFVESNASVAVISGLAAPVDHLPAWQFYTGRDRNTLAADPRFGDPEAGDFHLRSEVPAGRFDPVQNIWVTDIEHSPLIDAGDPSRSVALESSPNGGRVNIGMHANTAEASLSRTFPWLHAASFRRGGWAKGTATLHWVSGNLPSNSLVRVDVSADGGESWSVLSTGVLVTAELLSWNTLLTNNTAAALWRVTSLYDTNVSDQTTNFFSIRNAPLQFYLNDADTTGDNYAVAPGSPTNWVATASRPLSSVSQFFSRYDLEPGDVVYVDVGTYSENGNVLMKTWASGVVSNPVHVLGPTNGLIARVVRGSSAPGSIGLDLDNTSWMAVSNIVFQAAHTGVRVSRSANVSLSVSANANASNGMEVLYSTNIVIQQSVAARNQGYGLYFLTNTAVGVEHSVVWSNRGGAIRFRGTGLSVSNSVLHTADQGSFIYTKELAGDVLRSDFNDMIAAGRAQVGLIAGSAYRFLADWQKGVGLGGNSLSHDPLFADADADDYHPLSQAGRFIPGGGWVTNGSTSPLIDSGDPARSYANESSPNGGRLNMGLYGNHTQASRSPTNARLLALAHNDGGFLRGTNTVTWRAFGAATNHTVHIDFSGDGGNTWTTIVSGVNAQSGVYTNWDTTPHPSTVLGLWRVVSETDTNVMDQTDNPLTINNGAITYYVNDTNTAGDVYCSAPGSAANDGASPLNPALSVQQVLARYLLNPGDKILVDTGYYPLPAPIVFNESVVGESTNRIVMQGVSGGGAGGTIFDAGQGALAVNIEKTGGVELKDFRVQGASTAVRISMATNIALDNLSIVGRKGTAADVFGLEAISVVSGVARRVSISGVTNANQSAAVRLAGSASFKWLDGVLWSNRNGFVLSQSSSAQVSNSIFAAFGSGATIYNIGLGSSVAADYNNYALTNGAEMGRSANWLMEPPRSLIIPSYYRTVSDWVRLYGMDRNSLSLDPMFADPKTEDYHLMSAAGRYDPVADNWVFDSASSPLIDAGPPTAVFTNESANNGGRKNMGRYGNTAQASRTPAAGRLTPISYNDGGMASGTNTLLYWLASGAVTSHPLSIYISYNDGSSWYLMTNGIPAGTTTTRWNTTSWNTQPFVRWRVQSDNDLSIAATNSAWFHIRNSNMVYYVNDANTNGDVYTTAAGYDLFEGLSPDRPLTSLAAVVDRYDLEPGDWVYVDTGTYDLTQRVTVSSLDSGAQITNWVTIFGSTNGLAGGSVLNAGIQLDGARDVKIENLSIAPTLVSDAVGLQTVGASNIFARNIHVSKSRGHGFEAKDSGNIVFDHSMAQGSVSNGLYDFGSYGVVWQSGVLWSNKIGIVANGQPEDGRRLVVENSVIGALGTNTAAIMTGGAIASDYNAIYVTNGIPVALFSSAESAYPLRYETVGRWALDTGLDRHSLSINPLFIQPGTDFHPKSTAGRFDPVMDAYVNDTQTSWLIDSANPSASYSLESVPHGARRNIGVYGDTAESSRSPTNAELLAVSLLDGGIAAGTNQLLYWVARGAAVSDTVRIEYSPDNGLTWTTLAAGVSANLGYFVWDTLSTPSTVLGVWKVTSESSSNVTARSMVPFAVRNSPVAFYVNDGSTNGDVYCTAPGGASNYGVSPAAPMLSLQKLLDTYDIEPGDIIYVDTGIYSNSVIQLTRGDSGNTNGFNAVSIVGSTNVKAGGSVLLGAGPQATTLRLFDVGAIVLRDLIFRGEAATHIAVQESKGIRFERIRTDGARVGMSLNASSDVRGMNTIVHNYLESGLSLVGSPSISWGSGVFWSAGTNAISLSASSISVSNTAFGGLSSNSLIYSFNETATLLSEYNQFWLTNGATLARKTFTPLYSGEALLPMRWENLSRWTRDVGLDRFSLSVNPLFADPDAGDFHLQSAAGRYSPTSGVFVTDLQTSPLIDAGSPYAAFASETAPHGSRINIGAYGNTPWASRSPASPSLQVVSLNDGGRAEGNAQYLYWIAYGQATSHTIRIEVSTDGGTTWGIAQSNLPARISAPVFWDTTTTSSTARAFWRVVSEQSNVVQSTSRAMFSIRNAPLSFYVNDGSMANDVYVTAPGDPLQHGTSPDMPRDTLQSILDDYDLEPGDTIYMDTGLYPLEGKGIEWGRFDGWDMMTNFAPIVSGVSVTLQGSTNDAAGGTQITGYQISPIFQLAQAVGVSLRNISMRQLTQSSGTGLRIVQSDFVKLYRIETRNGETGFRVERSRGVAVSNSIARGNSVAGFSTFESTGTRWSNGLLWSNRYGVFQADLSTNTLTVENTAIGVWGSGAYAFFQNRVDKKNDGVFLSDYNSIYRNNGGFVAAVLLSSKLGGGTTRYEKATAWVAATGNDKHTLTGDPLFAGPEDFHPQSPAGRYLPGTGYVVNVTEGISPLIDAGRPSSSYGAEPSPNGARVNIGPYGNTAEASKTPTTNGALHVISLNDGASASGTIELYWTASGVATGHVVNLEYSSNGGGSWTSIVSGIPAAQGMYVWNSEPYGRAAAGLWRVVSTNDPTVRDVSDMYFALRNGGSIPYYVNDGSIEGDIYTTSIGSDFNDGFIPSTPKATLQGLLNAIDLEPGDIVYVDTGTYLLSDTTVFGDLDAGTPEQPVVIQGSTNAAAGGTVFDRQTGAGVALEFRETVGMELRDVTVKNANQGVLLTRSGYIRLDGVRSENNQSSFVVADSSSNVFVRSVSRLSSNGVVVARGDVAWINGVIYGTVNPFVLNAGGSLDLHNSYTRALGSAARIFLLANEAGSVTGDYNVYQRDDNALMYERVRQTGGNEILPGLTDWQKAYGQDLHSLSHAPLLVNPEAGDFTPRSAAGRFLPNGAMTNDPGVFSPLIDTGDPAFAWTNELAPNGARINIGHLGNTPRSSLSPTNPWLLALTYNDGGVIRGTVTVYWASGGMTNGTRVRLEQALDGVDFTTVASNILVSQGSAQWDVSSQPISYQARWRVVCESCGAQSQNETPVTIKNETLFIYINDANTNGDVYATAPGSSTNTGLSASQPLDSPETALQRYILGPDDIVYIDTGTYWLDGDEGLVVGLSGSVIESGISNHPIRIVGSTNYLAGGTLIVGSGSTNSYGLQIDRSSFVEASHLRIEGAAYGVSVYNSTFIRLQNVEVFSNVLDGLIVNNQSSLVMDRVALWGNQRYGMQVLSRSSAGISRSVFWGNRISGIVAASAIPTVSNSIIAATTSNSYGYVVLDTLGGFGGDYNIFWTTPGADLVRDYGKQVIYRNLRALQGAYSSDEHSVYVDPLFASPETGDFHLRSAAGRLSFTNWVNDSNTSWAIDAANPLSPFEIEPVPNGGRMNVGIYGNTGGASRSVTNQRALQIVSFDDGGMMPAPQYLRWLARGYADSDTVTLQFSPDLGVTWLPIATNVPASSGQFYWTPDPTNSSPITLWRIMAESGPPQGVTNSKYFALRLQPIKFYVNDDSLDGDIYSLAVGSSTNDGLTPMKPMDSLAAVVALYDMEPKDQVLVDTGYYMETNTVEFRVLNAGSTNSRVYITGSTNWQWGGTILNRASMNMGSQTNNDAVFDFLYTRHVDVSYFTIISANVAVVGAESQGLVFSNLVIRDAGRSGIEFTRSDGIIRNSTITRVNGVGLSIASGNATFDSGIIWSNAGHAISVAGSLRLTNSVIHATGTNYPYVLAEGAQVVSDYNNVVAESGARPVSLGGTDVEGLLQWSIATDNDIHSLSVNPLFASATNLDFHLLSEYGRFHPDFALFLTNDVETSYLVDAGPPTYAFDDEPSPNGGLRNMGLYGNTAYASKGRTNAWLRMLTGNSGGRGNGLIPIAWGWGQMAGTNRVALSYSYDNGTNWVGIASNLLVSTDVYRWDSSLDPLAISPIARLRVVLNSDTNVWDVTDHSFALNGPFKFYLNDEVLTGDVFTSAAGSDSNLGFYANAPMRTLGALLETWDLDPGDAVYIDTGVYPIDSNTVVTLGLSDGGSAEANVHLIASTNNGGARFQWIGPMPGDVGPPIVKLHGHYLTVSGARFEKGGLESAGTNQTLNALSFTNASLLASGVDTTVSNITIDVGNYTVSGSTQLHSRVLVRNGRIELGGTDITMMNSLSRGTQSVAAVSVSGRNISLINNTIVGSQSAVLLAGEDASLTLRNNILVANGAAGDAHVIRLDSGALNSDYNNLVARNGAWIGNKNGSWERLLYWQRESLQDPNSISADPLFADEMAGDLHLKSLVGRWTPSGVVTDAQHSASIDLGAPYLPYSTEPLPNGARANIGAYGNTEQASRSLVDPWLLAITLNDGGVVKGTNVSLVWKGGNLTNGATVSLSYSTNGGASWISIATGLDAASGSYVWDTTATPSSFDARWRVVMEGSTNIYDVVDSVFNVRNTAQNFFVNDASTAGDVYTSAPGSGSNHGRASAYPMNTLTGLLARYDTEGGDVIYVDTGVYNLSRDGTVIWSRGGDPTNGPLWIVGSTNFSAGGSTLTRGTRVGNTVALDIKASHVRTRNFTLQNAQYGALLDSNSYVVLERMRVTNSTIGVRAQNAFRAEIQNNLFLYLTNGVQLAGGTSNTVQNNVFYENEQGAISLSGGASPNLLQNNIFTLSHTTAVAYAGVFSDSFVDYNIYEFRTNNAAIFGTYRNLLQWQLDVARDYRSSVTNPLFANVGAGDFHLQSTKGRWQDGVGFVVDAQSSWGIDRGSSNSLYSLEPVPNGARINIGAYGNTEYASKGLVNTQVLVEARVLNQPTYIGQTNATWPLIWGAINVSTSELFRVEFSGDNGTTWYTLSNNVPAYQEFIVWSATPFFNTHKGRWRVVGVGNTNYWDINDAQFNLFFGTFKVYQVFYDQITNGIVFRGAWAEQYQVQWGSNLVGNAIYWTNAVTGLGPEEKASFLSTNGGDFTYRDIESVSNRYRLYRVLKK